MDGVDTVIVGAGAVGLAIARALSESRECLVIDSEMAIGQGVSSRNSEVIHAGIYYPTASLKAELCVRGKALLYEYCQSRDIPHARCGKLIVATRPEEEAALHELVLKAADNGVPDLCLLTGYEARALEPEVSASAAVLSPSTGIVSAHDYMLSLVADIERNGSLISVGSRLVHAASTSEGYNLEIEVFDGSRFELKASHVVNAAGLGCQEVARSLAGFPDEQVPARYLCRGHYFSLQGAQPFERLIYPVPPASGAGLGIHATVDLAGQVKFGPDTEYIEHEDYSVSPELKSTFAEAIQRYFPGLDADQLMPAYAGIRPKTQAPGSAPTDFIVRHEEPTGFPGWVNLFGIESPGLTASLAIGERVKQILVH